MPKVLWAPCHTSRQSRWLSGAQPQQQLKQRPQRNAGHQQTVSFSYASHPAQACMPWDSTVHGGPGPPTSISSTADAHRPVGWRQFLVGAFLLTGVSRFASDKTYVTVCPSVSPGFVSLLSPPNKFRILRYFSDICKEIPWDCQLPVNSTPHSIANRKKTPGNGNTFGH